MEFLRPNVLWIGGRCYRAAGGEHRQRVEEQPQYNSSFNFQEHGIEEEELENDAVEIEQLDDNYYRAIITIPNTLFGYIIGSKGLTKKRIENETGTRIIIPKHGSDDITIRGEEKKGVVSAFTRLSIIADSSRQKQPFTHFISIPLTDSSLKENLMVFKKEVISSCYPQSRGVEDSLFQNPEKFHLTIATLVLLNDADRKKASDLLQQWKHDIILPVCHNHGALVLNVEGLEYMNDDPTDVDVLYAKVSCAHNSDWLQVIANRIMERLSGSGLMVKQYDKVKIHATVMNTLFRTKQEEPFEADKPRKNERRQSFDASLIMQKYKDYRFGKIVWNQLHLSQRHSTAADGYYKATLQININ